MKLAFISGPYRAATEWQVEQNIREAEALALRVWKLGYAVICPHKNSAHFGGAMPDEVWLEGDLVMLRRCDAVFVTARWRDSEGARAEVAEATRIGLSVIDLDSQPTTR